MDSRSGSNLLYYRPLNYGLTAAGLPGTSPYLNGTPTAGGMTPTQQTPGSNGLLSAGSNGLLTAGNNGLLTAGSNGLLSAGSNGLLTQGSNGLLTPGSNGLLTPGSNGLLTTTGPKWMIPHLTPSQINFLFKNRLDKKRAQTPVKCDSCDITLNSDQQAKQHFNGKAHIKRLRKLGLPIPEEHQGKIHAKSGKRRYPCICKDLSRDPQNTTPEAGDNKPPGDDSPDKPSDDPKPDSSTPTDDKDVILPEGGATEEKSGEGGEGENSPVDPDAPPHKRRRFFHRRRWKPFKCEVCNCGNEWSEGKTEGKSEGGEEKKEEGGEEEGDGIDNNNESKKGVVGNVGDMTVTSNSEGESDKQGDKDQCSDTSEKVVPATSLPSLEHESPSAKYPVNNAAVPGKNPMKRDFTGKLFTDNKVDADIKASSGISKNSGDPKSSVVTKQESATKVGDTISQKPTRIQIWNPSKYSSSLSTDNKVLANSKILQHVNTATLSATTANSVKLSPTSHQMPFSSSAASAASSSSVSNITSSLIKSPLKLSNTSFPLSATGTCTTFTGAVTSANSQASGAYHMLTSPVMTMAQQVPGIGMAAITMTRQNTGALVSPSVPSVMPPLTSSTMYSHLGGAGVLGGSTGINAMMGGMNTQSAKTPLYQSYQQYPYTTTSLPTLSQQGALYYPSPGLLSPDQSALYSSYLSQGQYGMQSGYTYGGTAYPSSLLPTAFPGLSPALKADTAGYLNPQQVSKDLLVSTAGYYDDLNANNSNSNTASSAYYGISGGNQGSNQQEVDEDCGFTLPVTWQLDGASDDTKLDPVAKAVSDNIQGKLALKVKMSVPCTVCNLVFNSQSQATTHLSGAKHKRKVSEQKGGPATIGSPEGGPPAKMQALHSTSHRCNLCEKTFNSPSQLRTHLTSARHRHTIQAPEGCLLCEVTFEDVPPQTPDEDIKEGVAKLSIEERYTEQARSHYESSEHLQNMKSYEDFALQESQQPQRAGQTGNTRRASLGKTGKVPSQPVEAGYRCSPCDKHFNSPTQLQQHLQSAKHRNIAATAGKGSKGKAAGAPFKAGEYSCEICQLTVNSATQLQSHLDSLKHQQQLEQVAASPGANAAEQVAASPTAGANAAKQYTDMETETQPDKESYDCSICLLKFASSEQFIEHVDGLPHQQLVEQPMDCLMCAITFNSRTQAQEHYVSLTHQAKCEAFRDKVGRSTSTLSQDKYSCELCKKYFNSESQQQAHLKSSKHLSAEAAEPAPGCHVCGVKFNSDTQAEVHFTSPKHLRAVGGRPAGTWVGPPAGGMAVAGGKSKKKGPPQISVSYADIQYTHEFGPNLYMCTCCEVRVNSMAQLAQHYTGTVHREKTGQVAGASDTGEPEDGAGWACGEIPGHRGGMLYCQACHISVPTALMLQQHLQSPYHKHLQRRQQQPQISSYEPKPPQYFSSFPPLTGSLGQQPTPYKRKPLLPQPVTDERKQLLTLKAGYQQIQQAFYAGQ